METLTQTLTNELQGTEVSTSTLPRNSLELSEMTGKKHNDQLKQLRIENRKWIKTHGNGFIQSTYKDAYNRTHPMFTFTEDQATYLIQRFSSLKKNSDTLYVLKAGEFIKIGITTGLSKRVRSIQIANPYEVEVVYSLRTPAAKTYEQYLHEVFSDNNVRGEWFTSDITNQVLYTIENTNF